MILQIFFCAGLTPTTMFTKHSQIVLEIQDQHSCSELWGKSLNLIRRFFMCYWTFVGRDPCSHWKGNVDISIWGAANSNWFCSRNYIPNLKEKKILHIIWNIYIYWEEKYKNVLMHAIWGMFYVEHWGRSSTIKRLAQLVIQQIIITKNE